MMRTLVAALACAALVAAIVLPHPEVVLEMCSLVIVLLLVWLERRHSSNAARSAALHNLIEEFEANVENLYEGLWQKPSEKIVAETTDLQRGLRYYYDHVATGATQAALLNGALGRRKDAQLVQQLHHWERSSTICNTRFTMAELHLFFLPADPAGMQERLRLHASIAAKPVVEQRRQLMRILAVLQKYSDEARLPKRLVKPVHDMVSVATTSISSIEDITRDLWMHLQD
jgi:hypothetical protein